jgi:predicted Zn finger-like uncharacterized protein
MIAACPKCGARYRIDAEKLRPEGARLRCSRCEAVFQVRPPAARGRAQSDEVTAAQTPAVATEQSPARAASAEVQEPRARDRLVLVADPQVEDGKATANTLADWGLQPLLVHDGVEAILTIQRTLPRAVVLDAALPKMFGFQICELMKRNQSLREVKVVLVGAIHHRQRYRRPPSELYGADAYIERPQLPEALRPILQSFGLAVQGGVAAAQRGAAERSFEQGGVAAAQQGAAASDLERLAPPADGERSRIPEEAFALPGGLEPSGIPKGGAPSAPAAKLAPALPAPAAREAPHGERDPIPTGEIPGAGGPLGVEVAKAERLARIIVSDIVLYNQEKFDAAVRAGNVGEAIQSVVRDLDSADEEVRRLAVERAGALPVDEMVSHLVERLGDSSWRVRKAAVERLVACSETSRAEQALIAALGDGENPGRRNAAVEALIQCGVRAVPRLIEASASGDTDVRKLAVDSLAGIGDEVARRLRSQRPRSLG